jgi:hypothetical protein
MVTALPQARTLSFEIRADKSSRSPSRRLSFIDPNLRATPKVYMYIVQRLRRVLGAWDRNLTEVRQLSTKALDPSMQDARHLGW